MIQRTLALAIIAELALVVSLVLLFPDQVVPIVVLTTVAGSTILLPLVFHLRRERDEAALDAARRSGFAPVRDVPAELEAWYRRHRDARWYDGRIRGVSVGSVEGLTAWLLDLSFREAPGFGRGPARHGRRQSVLLIRWDGPALPRLRVSPEGWRDRVAEAFGAEDLDLPDDPEFSRAVRLRTDDEVRARSLLTPRVRHTIRSDPRWSVAFDGEWIAIYRRLRRLEDPEVRELVTAGRDLVAALERGIA